MVVIILLQDYIFQVDCRLTTIVKHTRTCSCILSHAGIVLVSDVNAILLCMFAQEHHTCQLLNAAASDITYLVLTLRRCLPGQSRRLYPFAGPYLNKVHNGYLGDSMYGGYYTLPLHGSSFSKCEACGNLFCIYIIWLCHLSRDYDLFLFAKNID